MLLTHLPPRFHVESNIQTFAGIEPLALIEITDRGAQARPARLKRAG